MNIRKLDKHTKAVILAWTEAQDDENRAKVAAIEAANPDVDWTAVAREVLDRDWRWYG